MSSEQSLSPSPPTSLSFKKLYNHFFLLHDFFHKLTKTKANSADQFDLQYEISNGMKNAVKTGQKLSQGLGFASLCVYFLRGNSIKLKVLTGFLFTYWYNHIIMLGAYAGAFARIPSVYKRTALFYQKHPQQKNLLKGLDQLMEQSDTYQDPQIVLTRLFGQAQEEQSYVANQFYVKNKDKYLPKQATDINYKESKKLPYMNSFLTRYIYYSFTRWCHRMKAFLTMEAMQ